MRTRREAARHQGGIREAADPHRHVEALLDQIDGAVVHHDIDLDLGIRRHEVGQRRGEVEIAETHRRVDLEAAARRAAAQTADLPEEHGGPRGPEPTRYGDWEKKGLAVDF